MKASDIMTAPVITISPETPVREIATLLIKRRISGVPVLEDERIVGLVSEGDLLRRHEIGTDRSAAERSWWTRLMKDDPTPTAYVRSHANRARDIMTRAVIVVAEDTSIADIATVLETHRIKRVPVLRGKRLVGIVSRANLIQALAVTPRTRKAMRTQGDEAIRRQLLAELEGQPWWRSSASNIIVTDGVVHFWGIVDSTDEKEAARVAAENLTSVRKVKDHRMSLFDLPSMV